VAALNALRREALAKLEEERGKPCSIAYSENIPPSSKNLPSPLWREDAPRRLVRLASADQLTDEVMAAADGWFLPLSEYQAAPPWGVEIPRGLFGTEEAVRRELAAAKAAGVRYALCHNVGAVPLAVEAGLCPVGGFGLNLTNREAVAAYAEVGLQAATLSMELAFSQMGFAADCPIPTGLFLYGRQPLMLTRNCPRQCAGGNCARCAPADGVTDRMGVTFPTACAGGCTELLNSVPLFWADRLEEIPPVDFWLLHMTDETPTEVARILALHRTGGKAGGDITRGLYRRGVE
jgi:putative protease